MLVYRVELEDGLGPYISDRNLPEDRMREVRRVCRLLGRHSLSRQHPIVHFDVFGTVTDDHYCGFLSVAELKTWFRGFIATFRRAKYFLATYEVEEEFVLIGSKQVAFVKDEAALLSKKRI